MFIRYATVRGFCEPVERLTGRTVKAFISGLHTEVDGVAIEAFILRLEVADAPSRIEAAQS